MRRRSKQKMSKRFALKKQEKRKNKGEGKTVLRVKRIIIW